MARVELNDVLERNGEPVGAATVTVKVVAGASGSTTLYAAETGATTLSALTTKENGQFKCWLEEGRYEITAGGMTKPFEAINQASVAAGSVGNETITTEKLKNEAVTEPKLANKAIGETKLSAAVLAKVEEKGSVAAEGITTEKLAALAVTAAKLGAESVEESKYKKESIAKTKLTKAFQEEIEAKAAGLIAISEKTAAYTLIVGDNEKCIQVNKASETIITIPENAKAAFAIGSVVEFFQLGAAKLELKAESGTVKLRSPESLVKSRTQYSTVAIRKFATDEWAISGDTA